MKSLSYLLIILSIVLCSCTERNNQNTISLYYYDTEDIQDPVARKIYNEGIDFAKNIKYQKAKSKFDEANNLEPRNVVIINSLGLVAQSLENFDESEIKYKEALKIDSLYINTYINYGTCLITREKYVEAIDVLENGKTKTKNSNKIAYLCYNLAISYLNSGDCNKAKETIEVGLNKLDNNSMIREFKKFKKEIIEICTE
jgi:Tfp pilus assembly protein PilF